MKYIPLTQGKSAVVNDNDYKKVCGIRWYAWFNPSTKSFYAVVSVMKDGKKRTIYLHRFLMNPPEGKVVDHKNHDTLDNRRSNLRICTQQDNIRSARQRKNSSGFKGVYWNPVRNKWQARIHDTGKKAIHLGLFLEKNAAAKAYNIAAKKLFGKFCNLNKI